MDDNVVLILASVMLLMVIAATGKVSKRFGLVNFLLFLFYSGYMYYGLFFDNSNGTALAWWF